jgi:hypothetical protein
MAGRSTAYAKLGEVTMHKQQLRSRLFVALLLGLVCSAPASAYVDPGTGMLLLQGLLALIGGIVFFVRNPLRALRALVDRLRKSRS